MRAETAGECLRDIGLGENAERIAALLRADRIPEARRALRGLRCGLLEEMHASQRRVDRMDWLLRALDSREDAGASGARKER